jgi:hypothetical protein
MRVVRSSRSIIGVSSAAVALALIPTTARAQIPVFCDENSLVNAISVANAVGGETLALAPFCTYTLTAAHGGALAGPTGLPPITTAITMVGLGTTIKRAPSAPAFRIIEVDGAPNVPGAIGRLDMAGVTISGGRAVSPYPGGGVANFGGAVSLVSSAVTGNSAVAGGGIYTDNGTVTLTASGVTGNTAASGGGIYRNSGTVALLASTVSGNTPDNCAPTASVPGCSG